MANPALINVNYGQLTFNNAQAKVGDGTHTGDVVVYSTVYSVGGVAVDAIVRTVSIDPRVTFNSYDSTDISDGNQPSGGAYFSPRLDGNTSSVAAPGAGVTFQIDFIASGSYSTATPQGTAVTLQNLRENTYDIDIQQYQQFTTFSTARMNTGGNITYNYDSSTGLIQFRSNSNVNASAQDSKYTIQVDYAAASSITFKVGSYDFSQATGLAYYYVDFGPGKFNNFDTTVTAKAAGVPVGGVSGLAFLDNNSDGIRNGGDGVLSNISVVLLDRNGAPTNYSTTTDTNGAYSFLDVPTGTYIVQFDTSGYGVSPQNAGGTASTNSDANSNGAVTVNITANNTITNIDAGFLRPASISGLAFTDSNGDGIQGSGEAGIASQTVQLLNAAGTVIASTTTGSNGAYSFTGVTPGTYAVQFTAVAGASFTAQDVGSNDAVDSDVGATGRTAAITLSSGGSAANVSAGSYTPASVSGLAFTDSNGDGIQGSGEAGIAGQTVQLLNAAGTVIASTTTGSNGAYSFTGVTPGTYAVQFTAVAGASFTAQDVGSNDAVDSDVGATGRTASITLSSGGSAANVSAGSYTPASVSGLAFTDSNGDGIQGSGEAGIAGQTVQLLNAAGTVIASTTTGSNGAYSFTGVTPGTYAVQFTAVAGASFTAQDVGSNDAVDSDVGATGRTAAITLSSGGSAANVSAGSSALAREIGGFVWLDANGNGLFDTSEQLLQGVAVRLLKTNGEVLGPSTTTDAYGQYSFRNIDVGSYRVGFAPLIDTKFTSQDQGVNERLDSDADQTTGVSSLLVMLGNSGVDLRSSAGLVLNVGRTPSSAPTIVLDDTSNGYPGSANGEIIIGNGGDDNLNGLGGNDSILGELARKRATAVMATIF
ncbi:SdrD B-like domain-containing protein [Paeniroseomonas aquatica]